MNSQSDKPVDSSPESKGLSRREFLKLSATAAGAVAASSVLAACGTPATPTAIPPTVAPAATKAPAVASGPKKIVIWARPSFTTFADDFIANVFKAWGAQNDTQVDYQVLSANEWYPKVAAAIEGKTVPDILQTYEYETMGYQAQNQIEDVTDIVSEIIGLEGGIFDSALMPARKDNKFYNVPYSVNPWVMHTRDDVLKAAGVSYPKTWEEALAIAPKIMKPGLFLAGQSLSTNNGDTNSKFMALAWGYGGQMQDEKGALMFKSPGTLAAIKLIKAMWDAKMIPPDAVTWDSSSDNKAYQSGQLIFEFNPNSVYAYLAVNDKDLLAKTVMNRNIGGPKGTFDMCDIYGWGILKGAKNVEGAKKAIRYFVQPENYAKVIEAGTNRWAPIYKNLIDRPMWQIPEYKNYKDLMLNGRVMSFAGPPNVAYAEVMSTWLIGKMLGDVCSGSKDPEKAMNDTYDKMSEIYKKWNIPVA